MPKLRSRSAPNGRVAVLYLSAVTSPQQFQAMKEARRPGVNEVTYGMIESGQKFGALIQDGLLQDPRVHLTSLVGRSVSHHFYTGTFWPRVRQRISDRFVIDHLGFPNLPVARQLWLAIGFAWQALRWRLANRGADRRILIADAAYITALPGVLAALGGNVTRLAIFADIYSYMGEVRDASNRAGPLHRALRALAKASYARLDGFVLLTEAMNQVVNPGGKPHIVMEGLVDRAMADDTHRPAVKAEHPTVLYAGALRREYGLADLVGAFRGLPEPDARLVIYGGGDYASEIERAARADDRIEYRGVVGNAEVVAAEEAAWLLVNPRPADQEFTRYSFPSKVMEYMVSGTPVLTTRLPGMPDEYLDFVFTVDAPGATGLQAALTKTLALTATELAEAGARGRSFVLNNKSNTAQAARILQLTNEE